MQPPVGWLYLDIRSVLRSQDACEDDPMMRVQRLLAPRDSAMADGVGVVRTDRSRCAVGRTAADQRSALPADQYVPSNAKIGLRCFHSPAVKSGNSSVWKLLAMDCSDSGVIALQVMAS